MVYRNIVLAICALILQSSLIAQKVFIHPGILFTQKSLDRINLIVEKKKRPEYGAYKLLKENPCADSYYQLKGPFKVISRDGSFGYTKPKMESDFSAAYLNALMFSATKDKDYARKSLEILEAYADELQTIPPTNDAPLLAGLEGFKIVTAAEILRYTYPEITKKQLEKITRMIQYVFLPVCDKFYAAKPYTNGNWGAIVTKMYMASAIFLDNEVMYKRAIDFYYHANDNGTITNYIDDSTGQIQESGRDQGHSQLGIGALTTICELAYNQGDDLYSALNNRLLRGFEYVARYNFGNDSVPFKVWEDVTGKYCNWQEISTISRGRLMPIYEMVYNHYVNRKGFSMPYTAKVLERIRPEGFDRDQPGFGTLLFYGAP